MTIDIYIADFEQIMFGAQMMKQTEVYEYNRQLVELLRELKKRREFDRKNARFINDWLIQNRIDELFSSEIKNDADILRIANETLTLRATNEFCKSFNE